MTAFVLKFVGGCLLACCGGGIGWLLACQKRRAARQIEAFIRFLQYIRESIYYRTLPGAAVLAAAARYAEYSPFFPEGAAAFSQIQPPDCLCSALGGELHAGLSALEIAPRQTACDTLDHLAELCRRTGQRVQESACQAMRLYPRLGICLGSLIAILLA